MTDRAASGAEIAVIGMSARLPGASTLDAFWKNLVDGRDTIRRFSQAELCDAGVREEELADPDYVRASPALEDIESFDAELFRFSPRDARFLDPQHRLFLECAWEALERGGYDPFRTALRIGVFAGASISTYLLRNLSTHPEALGADLTPIMFGNAGDFMPSRASYKLNLRGPSVNVQTACSTSLVAVHLGCQSLLSGESDMVLAGGATIQVPHIAGYTHRRESITSPDGRCRPFDAEAGGTVFGSGVGVTLLKRLEDALRDRDPILAVVLGSAVNNDGANKVGYTAPSVAGQAQVIGDALAVAGVEPETIGYVEAHGTGTTLGDPIEIAALAQVHGGPGVLPCAVGSVKSNIGHLDICAGIAGFMKTVLILQHGRIPPTAHFAKANPALGLERTRFFVNGDVREWPRGATPRRAGVSSFGIGGTNAHVVLEEAPLLEAHPRSGPELLLLSARTAAALEEAKARLAAHLDADPDAVLADVAHTLRVGRQAFDERCAVVAGSAAEAARLLRSAGTRGTEAGSTRTARVPDRAPRVVFVFPGQGAQYVGMAGHLLAREPAFRDDVEDICARFARAGSPSIRALLLGAGPDEPREGLDAPDVVQQVVFTMSVALVRQLERWGIRPSAVVGHSLGEYAAAYAAGVLELDGAVCAVTARAAAMAATAPGAMLSIALDEAAVRAIIGDTLDVAAINGPSAVVVSGRENAIAAAEDQLRARGVAAQRLRVRTANHSASMERAVAPLRAALAQVPMTAPKLPFLSSVTATWLDARTATDPAYWAEQVRRPVRFADAVAVLVGEPENILLEVGPSNALSSLARRQGARAIALLPARSGVEELGAPLPALGDLWLQGAPVALDAMSDAHRRRVSLPTYPFQRQRHWVEPAFDRASADVERAARPDPAAVARADEGAREPSSMASTSDEVVGATTERALTRIWEELLGVSEVALDDEFYELGGDSLVATQIVARIRKELGVDLRVRDLVEARTIRGLTPLARVPARRVSATIPRRARGGADGSVPMSFAQERLWFLDRLDPGSPSFNIAGALRLEGPLDVAALQRALVSVVQRHETLRTTFEVDAEGRARAVVHPTSAFEVRIERLEGDRDEQARGIDRAARREAGAPFDLARGPLMRALLLVLNAEHHVLLLTLHHIVADGWSLAVLGREVTQLYGDGAGASLPELEIQYSDYAAWQRETMTGDVLAEQLAYWKAQLADAPFVLDFPTDRPRPPLQSTAGAHLVRHLTKERSDAVDAFARRLGATPFSVLLAAYATLLARHSAQRDLVVGTPVANRTRVEVEGLVGMFVNTLALRVDLSAAPSTETLVADLARRALSAHDHQGLPFERLVDALGVERDPSRTPVFQTMFALQNTPRAVVEARGLRVAPAEIETGLSSFDLSLDAVPLADGYRLQWEYSSELFERSTIVRLAERFEQLLESMLAHPGRAVERLLFEEPDGEGADAPWNRTHVAVPEEQTVHGLVEAQARRAPDATAIEQGPVRWTYQELEARANTIARSVRDALDATRGVTPLVVVCMDRSPELVAVLLGIAKAGGVYVPIDPSVPRERVCMILADSGARVAVATAHVDVFDGCRRVDPAATSAGGHDSLPFAPKAHDPVYVIYTSGSTGRPKGVVVEHRAVVNYVLAFGRVAALGPTDRVLQFASVGFDASVEEIFGALAHGATLVLRTDAMLASPSVFLAAVESLRIGVLDLPTAYWGELASDLSVSGARLPACVRLVVLGGERVPRDVLRSWLSSHTQHARLLNTYGPTEATVVATIAEIEAVPAGEVPIGHPVSNVTTFVLDAHMSPVPLGAPGELYLGGAGLARGYLDRPDLTAERFVPNPFGAGRLYRTGDRVRRLPGGELVYLGRTDDQVKVRGYRVELGEVESALRSLPPIRDAVVLAGGEGAGRKLTAYVVPAGVEEGFSVAALRQQLRERLPDYMVPSEVLVLDALPLSPSGKVDRRGLARMLRPEGQATGADAPHVAPRTALELALCELWEEVLGVDRVGLDDDFFELGGHSLLVIRLAALAKTRLGIDISIPALMTRPTIASMLAGEPHGSPFVRLGEAVAGAPRVVVVHALSGEVFPYVGLAKGLQGVETLGLRSPLVDGREAVGSLSELAAIHVASIGTLGRPVHLVGWSAGGVIAHEMACQLEALGCPAQSLTILDASPAGPRTSGAPDHVMALISMLGGRRLSRLPSDASEAVDLAARELGCDRAVADLLLAMQLKHLHLVEAHSPAETSTPTLVVSCAPVPAEGIERWADLAPVRSESVSAEHEQMLSGAAASAVAALVHRHALGAR